MMTDEAIRLTDHYANRADQIKRVASTLLQQNEAKWVLALRQCKNDDGKIEAQFAISLGPTISGEDCAETQPGPASA